MRLNSDRKKVFVALSGGVDSSVSAALLQREGYDVTGVFIKTWHPDFLPCTWKEERLDAMRVCATLTIPFLTFDFEPQYKEHVVDYMISEYAAGRTPNPDVMCNRYIKFGAFLKEALGQGADYIATGHYAVKKESKINNKRGFQLYAGVDTNKDQSYFLWTLNQEVLKSTLFPVGKYTKPEVRKMAQKFGLLTAEKKDSQGLCFMGSVDMKEFLERYIPVNYGDVIEIGGKVVGIHSGTSFSTIGQRHGFTASSSHSPKRPYYVVQKDVSTNTLTVSHKPQIQKMSVENIHLDNENWVAGAKPSGGSYVARFRHRQEPKVCKLFFDSASRPIVQFKKPQVGLSSGQSLVLYDRSLCIGGGVMK